jgi:hypothetical protein
MKAIIHAGTGTKAGQFTFYLKGKNGKVVAKARNNRQTIREKHHYKDFTYNC